MVEGKKCSRYQAPVIEDKISRRPKSSQDVRDISIRLYSATTRAHSLCPDCKPWESPKPPGEGQKALPIIEGIEQRFSGRRRVSSAHTEQVTQRLYTSHTTTFRAKRDKPAILLYPEKTYLMTNRENRDLYYNQHMLPKQNALETRAKWFN